MKLERRQKAESICKRIIGEYIISVSDFYSDEHGIINLLRVEISPDASYMDVYISSSQGAETLPKTFAQHAHKITHILGKSVNFMKVPKLRFRYDDSGEISSHIYDTLSEISGK